MSNKWLFLLVVLCIGLTTALTINDAKTYDTTSKTVTIKESLLGADKLNATLNTPLLFYTGYGDTFKVAEFEVINTGTVDLNNLISKMKIINLNNNREESKTITYKYKVVTVNVYNETTKTDCKDDEKTNTTTCKYSYKNITYYGEAWYPISDMKLLKGQSMTIGLFTYVNKGDKYEWIPEFLGSTEVEEWAVWSASLETSMNAYYQLNESTGTNLRDSFGSYNGTAVNSPTLGSVGKINNSITTSAGTDFVNVTVYPRPVNSWSINFWTKHFPQSAGANTMIGMEDINVAPTKRTLTIYNFQSKAVAGLFTTTGGEDYITGSANISTNAWTMVTVTYNETHTVIYVNGTQDVVSTAASGTMSSGVANGFAMGQSSNYKPDNQYVGSLDEVGLWNRTLTAAEVTDLWNSGAGLAFRDYGVTAPTIYLLAPAKGSTVTSPTQNFVCNVTSSDGIRNVSLMVNNTRVSSNTTLGVNATNYTFTYTLPSASFYQWTCEATGMSNLTTYNLSNYTITYSNYLAVTSLVPVNFYNISTSPVTIIGNASDDTAIINVSLVWNGVREQTNSTGLNNTNYTFSKTISSDGTYLWGLEACDSVACALTSNRTITFDTTIPNITVFSPTGVNDYANRTSTVFINHTTSDALLSMCWYSINGAANTTYTCGTNFSVTITQATNNLTLWANDTLSNIARKQNDWSYRFMFINQSYIASTTEGTSVNFNITIQTNGVDLTSAILNYSGTSYTGSASELTNNWTIGRYINAPSVSGTTNYSFYWNLTRDDGSFYVFDTFNQTVQDFQIDNCSNMTGRYYLYNFTIVDEEDQLIISPTAENTSAEFDMTIYTQDLQTAFGTFSLLYNRTNPFQVCLTTDLSGSTFVADAQVQYSADGYSTEFYNIQRETLTNADIYTNITLYDLNLTQAQEFQLNYKDSNFIPVEGAIIQIYRKYISEGEYKIVEIPITSTDGNTLAHLELSDVIYKFVVIRNGEVLSTFNDQLAYCDNVATGDCVINLNAFGSGAGSSDLVQVQGIAFSLSYDEATRTLSSPFIISAGTPSTVVMNVTLFDGLGNTSICTDTVISSTGTLECVVPQAFENYTLVATVTKDGTLTGRAVFSDSQSPQDRYAGNYVFLALFTILIIIGIGVVDSPVIMAVMMMLGVIVLAAFGFITNRVVVGVGSSVMFLFIAIIIFLIKSGRRE